MELNTSFFSGFYFLNTKDNDIYLQVLKQFKYIIQEGFGKDLGVFIFNNKSVLKKAIYKEFPNAQQLLYTQYKDKNILAEALFIQKTNNKEEDNKNVQQFISDWVEVLYI